MSLYLTVILGQSRLFREGLGQLLHPGQFTVVGSARSFSELVPGPERPDLVIFYFDTETSLEEQFGNIRRARMGTPVPRMVILADLSDLELLSRAIAANIDAVLSKDISSEVLQLSLELVMLGQSVFPASVSRILPLWGTHFGSDAHTHAVLPPQLVNTAAASPTLLVPEHASSKLALGAPGRRPVPLSDREDQILERLVAGAPNKAIARHLGITEGTVKVHVKSLLRKLGATNRTQAAIWGVDRGSSPRDVSVDRRASAHAVGGGEPPRHSIEPDQAIDPPGVGTLEWCDRTRASDSS